MNLVLSLDTFLWASRRSHIAYAYARFKSTDQAAAERRPDLKVENTCDLSA